MSDGPGDPVATGGLEPSAVAYNPDGLVPVIAQDASTGEVLMMAWMNEESLRLTLSEGRMVYWSRSRRELWRKGDTSGNQQVVREARIDCDGDALLFRIDQLGDGACHTGERSCFHRHLVGGNHGAVGGNHGAAGGNQGAAG